MWNRILLGALMALLLIPDALSAQRRRRGTTPPDYDRLGTGVGNVGISVRDMQGVSPIKALLDKRKDLALTEDQTRQLQDLDGKMKGQTDSLFHQLDSLRKEMKPSPTAPPEVDRIRLRGVRTSLVEVVKAIRGVYDATEPQVLATLKEDQQKAANDLLDKLQQDTDEMVQQKLGGGRRGG